jgi:hypothetical protein
MTFVRRTTTTAAAFALAAFALSGPALSAQAAGAPHWKTLVTVIGAKVQACKVPETATGPWKIKLRVDATKASGRVSGAAYITKKGETTGAQWKSGWVAPGQMSALGSVKLPAGEKYAMDAGLGTSAMGDGGTFTSSNLPHC